MEHPLAREPVSLQDATRADAIPSLSPAGGDSHPPDVRAAACSCRARAVHRRFQRRRHPGGPERPERVGVSDRRRQRRPWRSGGRRRPRVDPGRRDSGSPRDLVGADQAERVRADGPVAARPTGIRAPHRGADPRQPRAAPREPSPQHPADDGLPQPPDGVRHSRQRELAHDQHDDPRLPRRSRRHGLRPAGADRLGPRDVPRRHRLLQGGHGRRHARRAGQGRCGPVSPADSRSEDVPRSRRA